MSNTTEYCDSFGIIYRKPDGDEAKDRLYLLVKRRNTQEYETIIRGRYTSNQLYGILKNIIPAERKLLIENSFEDLWLDIHWGDIVERPEYDLAKLRFETIQDKLEAMFEAITPVNNEKHLWSFPKGKREHGDMCEYDTAHREFYEETLLKISKRDNHEDLQKMEVIKMGTDHRHYRTFYFVVDHDPSIDDTDPEPQQMSKSPIRDVWYNEIQELLWVKESQLGLYLDHFYMQKLAHIE